MDGHTQAFSTDSGDCYGNNYGMVIGSVTQIDGWNGKAALFGGFYHPGSIRIPNSPSLQFKSDFTVAFAVNLTGWDGMNGYGYYNKFGTHSIFAKRHDRSGMAIAVGTDLALVTPNGNKMFVCPASYEWGFLCSGDTYVNPNYSIGNWINIVYVFSNSSHIIKIYINGSLASTKTNFSQSFVSINSNDIYIGKFSDTWFPLNGSVDELLIYNRSLSETEIRSLANKSKPNTVETTQIRPNISPIQPPPQSNKLKGLVLIAHGWNSDVSVWPNRMAEKIKAITKDDPNVDWTILPYAWAIDSGYSGCIEKETIPPFAISCKVPWDAYTHAGTIGRTLGKNLAKNQYDYIHFIGHSAGSNLIDKAATYLRVQAINNHLKVPKIHSTFFDAYDVLGSNSLYGLTSDWAEQYVDIWAEHGRGVWPPNLEFDLELILKDSDIFLKNSYNIDVTNTDLAIDPVSAHAIPYEWYESTIGDRTYGFPLSIESRQRSDLPSHKFYKRGQICSLSSSSFLCPSSDFTSSQIKKDIVCPNLSLCPNMYTGNPFTSGTGKVELNPENLEDTLRLSSGSAAGLSSNINMAESVNTLGSPVWATRQINVPESVNTLFFDYQFLSNAEGLLSVFFDNQLVYKADERYDSDGLNVDNNVPIGKVEPGVHSISFRIDPFTETQSVIEISNIKVGNVKVVDVVNTPPLANADIDQTVFQGSLVTLNGTASNDPDNGPSPLTYAWTQTSGPSVTLTGQTSATPSFTPAQSGIVQFQLIVNDGQTSSAPAIVTITVYPPNLAPIANAGMDRTVLVGQVVTLNGSASIDPDSSPLPLTYDWRQTAGPAVTLTNPTSTTPNFTPTQTGLYTFSLMVSDEQDFSLPDSVTFLVQVDTAILTVSKVGSGSGKVSSIPAGIDCGTNCAYAFDKDTVVTLSPLADNGWVFTGWSGVCHGKGATCQVTMDKAKSVTARFGAVRMDALAIDFNKPNGLWIRHANGIWEQLHPLTTSQLVSTDLDGNGAFDLVVDFKPYGIWAWMNRKEWTQLRDVSPVSITAADLDANASMELVASFAESRKINALLNNQQPWQTLFGPLAKSVTAVYLDENDWQDLLLDFAPYGLWQHLNNRGSEPAWMELDHNRSPGLSVVGDLDGNGHEDVVFSFGADGSWKWMNNSTWVKLHPLSPLGMVTADLDGNGKTDVAFNFGNKTGLWVFMNNQFWVQRHPLSPVTMAAAYLDNNNKQDLVIDFAPHGIWVYKNNLLWEKLINGPKSSRMVALPE